MLFEKSNDTDRYTMSSYNVQAKQIESEVLQYHNQQGWTAMESIRGVAVWYKESPHFAGHLYKFECDVDMPHHIVYNVMKLPATTEDRLAWDKTIKHYQCLEKLSDELMIGQIISHSAAEGCTSPREFVFLYFLTQHVNSSPGDDFDLVSWIYSGSVDHPSRPPTDGCVRARNYPGGFAVSRYREKPDKCKLTLYLNVDIGGNIPQHLVDSEVPSQQVAHIESVKSRAAQMMMPS